MVEGGTFSNTLLIKHVRDLVRSSNGSCTFTDGDGSLMLMDDYQVKIGDWMHSSEFAEKPSLADAIILVRRYAWVTGCVGDLFNANVLLEQLLTLYQSDGGDLLTLAKFYLVWAIGLQASPDGDDWLANRYFQRGRYLAAANLDEGPTVESTQCDVLITWFLLSAGRRNAAYVQLGPAVRAAYALNLHHRDTDAYSNCYNHDERERLWKTICVLDGFMTTAFGKPSSITYETHDHRINGKYSSTYDLCLIFESIQQQVYAGKKITNGVVVEIAAQHRRWSSLFQQGIETDGISSADFLECDGTSLPNIGIYHLREAYYWSIMLLTLPFLTDFVSQRIIERCPALDGMHKEGPVQLSLPVYTCLSAAISTLEMLEKLFGAPLLPRRLPFVVNSAFFSAMIIGISLFGDVDGDDHFLLQRYLGTAQSLLSRLGTDDHVAREASMIVADLQKACDAYLNKRQQQRTKERNSLFAGLFGDVGGGKGLRLDEAAPAAIMPIQQMMDALPAARTGGQVVYMDDSYGAVRTATTEDMSFSMPVPSVEAEEAHLDIKSLNLQGSSTLYPVDSSDPLYPGVESPMDVFPFTDEDFLSFTHLDTDCNYLSLVA
ncbi:hypothetical protein RBB50_010726 [Rhinocladiella similis]